MNFDFAEMKPVIQREFDEILDCYPTDFSSLRERVPRGGDVWVRKLFLIETAAEECPVRLFAHYPFAFELDMGESRQVGYRGIGNLCQRYAAYDADALQNFRKQIRENGYGAFNDYTDYLHNTLDHKKLLERGFRGVYEECVRLNETETNDERRQFREAVMRACRAVERIGLRLRALAAERMADAIDEDARYNFARIAASTNTPWEPAETYFDALNAILSVTLWISGLDGVEMNAYGQVDLLLQPYYQQDLEKGILTQEEACFLLQCFLYKTDLHCHFNEERKIYDNGVSVAIGGCDPDGNPVYNEITDMILDVYTAHKLINPKLNARAGAGSPRAYLTRLAALMKTGNNNLVIENDDYIIPMFCRMGLDIRDARTYIGNGCQEVVCRCHKHDRAFVYLNLPKVLLDTIALARGTEPNELRRKLYCYGRSDANSFDALYQSFLANLYSYTRMIAETFAPYEQIHGQINPSPMLSAFTDDCITRGIDISTGGARYNHKTFSLVGFGTLCDSLLALRTAYENGTTQTLFAAMDRDYAGCEPYRLALQKSPERFGHSEKANIFAAELANALSRVTRGIMSGNGVEWGTSLFTYSQYNTLGRQTGATPDGRHAGERFSRQMNMVSIPALTEAARAMSYLTDADFHDVGMFDIALPYSVAEGAYTLEALTGFIATCLALRIPVLQPNVADRKTMVEERSCHGTHPDLVVRICGYSAMFSELSEQTQDEVIARTSHSI